MSIMLGIKFNQTHNKTKFCKLLTDDLTHNSYYYKMNELNECFDFGLSNESFKGFCFYDVKYIDQMLFYKSNLRFVVDVEVPDDAIIIINKQKNHTRYKTNKIILTNLRLIEKLENFTSILIKNPNASKFITVDNATTKIINILIDHNPNDFELFHEKVQNDEIVNKIMTINPKIFKHIRKDLQIFSIIKTAVIYDTKQFNEIKNFDNLTSNELNDIYDIIVNNDFHCLSKIKNEFHTYELCIRAVKFNGEALKYVRPDLHTIDMYMIAVKSDSQAFKFTQHFLQTQELCELAIELDGLLLKYVRHDIFSKVCVKAIELNGLALEYVEKKTQSFEICKIAVKSNNKAIKYVNNKYKYKFYNHGCWLFGLKSEYATKDNFFQFDFSKKLNTYTQID